MEENSVLVVVPCVEDLLVPDDSSVGRRNVNHLDPVGIADEVVGKHHGALQSSERPSRLIRVGNVETGDCDGLDLVALLGDEALDRLLVVVVQDGRHRGGGSMITRAREDRLFRSLLP